MKTLTPDQRDLRIAVETDAWFAHTNLLTALRAIKAPREDKAAVALAMGGPQAAAEFRTER